jgi:hypothetical protein
LAVDGDLDPSTTSHYGEFLTHNCPLNKFAVHGYILIVVWPTTESLILSRTQTTVIRKSALESVTENGKTGVELTRT